VGPGAQSPDSFTQLPITLLEARTVRDTALLAIKERFT
jgi:hypothetical protein